MNRIALVDCNNFFVSCERLFRPDLLQKPVLVLSSNDGCVVARSQEVKDMGIPMGVPHFQIKDMCRKHHIHVFSSNFGLYRDISRRVMKVIRDEVGVCDQYSIDEAFFPLQDDFDAVRAQALRSVVMRKVGIPVSIGIAATKTLAKLANRIAKAGDGVHILTSEGVRKVAPHMSCSTVWGVGRSMSRSLQEHGIMTVADFMAQPLTRIRQISGVVGERLYHELNGVPVRLTIQDERTPGSFERSASFKKGVYAYRDILHTATQHTENILYRVRREELCISHIQLTLYGHLPEEADKKTYTHGYTFSMPTSSVTEVLRRLQDLCAMLYRRDMVYAKVGVWCGGVVPDAYRVTPLFDETHLRAHDRDIDNVRESVISRYGRDALRSGLSLETSTLKSQRQYRSPAYTTEWSALATVQAK